jgi:uncharacterized delta-60 repeat protein
MKKLLAISLLLFSATAFAVDSDGDGVDDSIDAFPNDPTGAVDTDGDGKPDTFIFDNLATIFADSFESGDFTAGGWTLGGTMTGTPWTIFSYGGSNGKVAKLTQTTTCGFGCTLPIPIAYIEKTVTLPSSGGAVGFSLRGLVSFDYGPAEFYVDNILQQQWTSLSSWTPVTKSLSAGTHTLKWQTSSSIATGHVYVDAVVVKGSFLLIEDADDDNDGVADAIDNCPLVINASQSDMNGNAIGDACDYGSDTDGDGVNDSIDNCAITSNSDQLDDDADGIGNACELQVGLVDSSFSSGSGANDEIKTIAVQPDGKMIIGGRFTSYNGTARNHIARLNADGTLDSSFDPGSGTDGLVNIVALLPDGKIIITGSLTSYNGTLINRIARLNANGSLDSSFNFNPGSGATGGVSSVALLTDGKMIIGGTIISTNDTPINRIARLNADGSLDSSFNPGSGANIEIKTIAVQADGKILIGGQFTTYNGIARNRIARLNADGSLDSSFDPGTGTGSDVSTCAVQSDGKIVIGGSFTSYNGTTRNRIARLNADGTLDGSFDPGSGSASPVYIVAAQPDGKIIIGGAFASYRGTTRRRIARSNTDGTLDSSFHPGSGANNSVFTVVMQPDGKIIIGGAFITYNGLTTNRIVRIHSGDGDADSIEDAADQFPNDTDNDGLTNDIDPDDDNDGMPDTWETSYGLNPLVNDASGDLDGDGLTNLQEYTSGTDPTVPNNISASIKNDYNHDGIAGWIWKGISNGNETASQNWQLTFPLYSPNWGVPNRFYHPVFPDQLNWEIMTSGDFNKDGDADILWRNTSTAQWKIWQMQNGARVAQTTPPDFDPAHEWVVIGAGDTDKDGDDDVILNNTVTGEVLVWEMQDHAIANTHAVGTKAGYTLNRIGDFNKDGDVDLLFREVGADVLVTWEIENNAFVIERALANTGTNYNPVCAGDFDNDGDDDIMLVNSTTTQEKWFVMESFARTQVVGATNSGFVFRGCGDFDGDGDADMLWQRLSDDANRVILQQNYGASKQTVYTNAFGAATGFVYRGNSN